jgi:hypothetical protein
MRSAAYFLIWVGAMPHTAMVSAMRRARIWRTYLCVCVAAVLTVACVAQPKSALVKAGGSVTVNQGPEEVRALSTIDSISL